MFWVGETHPKHPAPLFIERFRGSVIISLLLSTSALGSVKMMIMLDEKLLSKIADDCQLSQAAPIVVGVSGGADSLCLLAILHQLGFPLIAAHFNHQLRDDALGDELFVAEIAKKFGIPLVTGRGPVGDYANLHHQSIEEAARTLRYLFLFNIAQEHHAQAVAVGHTADDQVETVLMHFLRGSGLKGLKGMDVRVINPAWRSTIPLVRPLLGIWHAETLAICASEGLNPVTDQTNSDVAYQRNRLRHELIPYLERYNPKLRETIWRTALTLGGDYALIDQAAKEAWQEVILLNDANGIVMRRTQYLNAPVSIQRQLLRKAIETLRSLKDIDLDIVERARAFILSPSRSRRTDLAARLTLTVAQDQVFIVPWGRRLPGVSGPAMPGSQPIKLPLPGKIDLSEGWWIEAALSPGLDAAGILDASGIHCDPDEAVLDYASLSLPLVVRGRQAGDRWQPYGMLHGVQKLSDFFINEKIQASLRDGWPLICSGDEIVWVAGYRIGHPFRVTPQTKQVLRLRLSRELS